MIIVEAECAVDASGTLYSNPLIQNKQWSGLRHNPYHSCNAATDESPTCRKKHNPANSEEETIDGHSLSSNESGFIQQTRPFNYTFTVFVEPFFDGFFLLDAFPLLPFTPPTAFVLRERISRSTTTAMITITTITINTIATTGIQNPVAFCHSPSFLPSTHALFCVPT